MTESRSQRNRTRQRRISSQRRITQRSNSQRNIPRRMSTKRSLRSQASQFTATVKTCRTLGLVASFT